MKKYLLTGLLFGLASVLGQAVTLFPHFVDVAGDFSDGTCEKFEKLSIPVKFHRVSPYFYKDIKSAESFLKDTLPFSNYPISTETKTLPDGTVITVYTSSLEADGLNKDKWSKLYLIQTPDEPLYVGLYEDAI